MSETSHNPWANRFTPLLDRNEIIRRATLTPAPLGNLSHLSRADASKKLRDQLEAVYFPTTQCVDILYDWVVLAQQHCLDYYPDISTFMGHIHAEKSPLPEFRPPICLTGHAGSGKSALVKAYKRILGPPLGITLDPAYQPFPLVPIWSVTVHAATRPQELLGMLCGASGTMKYLVESCRRIAYRDGASFQIADEFQFATGSSEANALITQMLLSAGYIGLPNAYAANFSLLHRLMKRPAEDRHRLLANPTILRPEAPESRDWCSTLQAQKEAAPEIFEFNPVADGPSINRLSGGDMRAEVTLLVEAYSIARKANGVVTLREIELAVGSTTYAAYRLDLEAIAKLDLGDSKVRKQRRDLWCPLDLATGTSGRFANRTHEERQARANDQAIRDSMTSEEQKALAELEQKSAKKPSSPGKALPIKQPKSQPTAATLAKRFAAFRERT